MIPPYLVFVTDKGKALSVRNRGYSDVKTCFELHNFAGHKSTEKGKVTNCKKTTHKVFFNSRRQVLIYPKPKRVQLLALRSDSNLIEFEYKKLTVPSPPKSAKKGGCKSCGK